MTLHPQNSGRGEGRVYSEGWPKAVGADYTEDWLEKDVGAGLNGDWTVVVPLSDAERLREALAEALMTLDYFEMDAHKSAVTLRPMAKEAARKARAALSEQADGGEERCSCDPNPNSVDAGLDLDCPFHGSPQEENDG